jgi:hypothetical protein
LSGARRVGWFKVPVYPGYVVATRVVVNGPWKKLSARITRSPDEPRVLLVDFIRTNTPADYESLSDRLRG